MTPDPSDVPGAPLPALDVPPEGKPAADDPFADRPAADLPPTAVPVADASADTAAATSTADLLEGEGALSSEAEPGSDGAEPGSGRSVAPEEARRRRSIGPLGVVVAGICAIAFVGAALSLASSLGLGGSATASPEPSTGSDAFAEGRALGDAGAPVAIDIWADFQCPYCGLQARGVTPSIERLYAAEGRARIVYHDFAFLGQESLDAAVAARCAEQQGAFWYYHDLLFASQQGENQGAFARERLVGLADFADLDGTAFAACLDDPAVAKAVTDETEVGRALGVTSTPVLRIDGPGGLQVITGLQPLSSVDAAIELAEQPQPSSSPGASASPGPGQSVSSSPSGSPSPSPDTSPTAPTPSPTP